MAVSSCSFRESLEALVVISGYEFVWYVLFVMKEVDEDEKGDEKRQR